MGTLKTGGRDGSVLASNASPFQKRDTSMTLSKAKLFALESKKRMLKISAADGRFIVTVTTSTVPKGTARILSREEIEDLRKTKSSVAERTMEVLNSTSKK